MKIPLRAVLGSILIVVTYLFWFAYVQVLRQDLFYFYPWIDIPFHVTGGFILTLLCVLVYLLRHSELEQVKLGNLAYPSLWGMMMIGVIWEYYEYFFNLQDTRGNVAVDTLADLGNDFIGGLIALGLVYYLLQIKQRKQS